MANSPEIWFDGICKACGYPVVEMSDPTGDNDYANLCTNTTCMNHVWHSAPDDAPDGYYEHTGSADFHATVATQAVVKVLDLTELRGGKVLVCRLGDDNWRPCPEDVNRVSAQLKEIVKEHRLALGEYNPDDQKTRVIVCCNGYEYAVDNGPFCESVAALVTAIRAKFSGGQRAGGSSAAAMLGLADEAEQEGTFLGIKLRDIPATPPD